MTISGDLIGNLVLIFALVKFRKEKLDISLEREGLSVGKSNLIKQLENYCKLLSNLNKVWGFNEYRGKLELQELLFPLGIVYDVKMTVIEPTK